MKRLIFIIALLFAAVADGGTTTQPTVKVRDCTAKADTDVAIVNGGDVTTDKLPAHWTLDFDFGKKSVEAIFKIDGKAPAANQFWSAPYCPAGHNTPIDLAIGSHTIALNVNGVDIAPYTFLVDRPVVVTDQIAAASGVNGEGVSYPSTNLATHPQYLQFLQKSGRSVFRVWIETGTNTIQPAKYYAPLLPWHAAGINVDLVINFQHNAPQGAPPSDAQWSAWCTGLPPPGITGAVYLEIGNEINTGYYYTGTAAQMAHMLAIGYPILHAKGYQVIAPSILNSTNEMQSLLSLGAYKYCDYVNYHSYRGNADQIAADADDAGLIATQANKPLAMTEWGTRPANKSPPTWSAEQVKAIAALRQRGVMEFAFPFFVIANNPDVAAPFTLSGAINQPFYDAMIAGN